MRAKRLIYIVDDQEAILSLILMILQANSEWQGRGFINPKEAFEAVKAEPPDLIISDQCMPEMYGSELLELARNVSPDTVRIIMSGYIHPADLSQITVAHQYILKPFALDRITSLIARTCEARDSVSDPALRRTITSLRTLPAMPHAYKELVSEIERSCCSTERIAQLIANDPGISAKVLQMANSALYRRASAIATPLEAVLCLGTETVRAIVISQQLFQQFGKLDVLDLNVPQIWNHSWDAANCARHLCLLQGAGKVEEAFLAGLLHDLGKLVFMDNFPAQYRTACEAARRKSQPLSEAEREVFQASHTEVGGYLLRLWAMPEDVIEAVIHQNHPTQSNHSEFSALTALYAGNIISRKLHPPDPFVTPEWDMSYLESIGCQNRVREWEESCASLLRENRTRH